MLTGRFAGGFLAGLCISLGSSVYLSCDDKYIGAFFFSVALLTICMFGFSLFTGMVGFTVDNHTKSDIAGLLIALAGNLTGCILFGTLLRHGLPQLAETAAIVCEKKLLQTPLQALIRSFFCGVLMYAAVWIYKFKNSLCGIFLCVPVFILCGFEHSIANGFYFSLSWTLSLKSLLYTALFIIGNSFGAVLIPLIIKISRCSKNG